MPVSQIDASYLRLSLEDNEVMKGATKESNSIVSQRLCIDEYVAAHSDVPQNLTEFSDDGFSGTSMERPSMKRLLQLVSLGRVRTIIVRDLSRFARDYLEAGHYLEYIFPAYNVRFISINDNYDSAQIEYGNSKAFEIAVRNLLNQWYSRDLSRKIQSAVNIKKMRGEYVYGTAPFGYKKGEKKNTIVIDPPAAEIVRRLFELAVSGKTITQIAQIFNRERIVTPSVYLAEIRGKYKTSAVWSYEMVQNIMINHIYTGDTVPFKSHVVRVGSNRVKPIPESEQIVIPDTHEPIISREVFYQAREVVKGSPKSKTNNPKNVLSGYLVCGCCGRKLTKGRGTNKDWLCAMARYTDETECKKIRLNEASMKEKLITAIQMQCKVADASVKEVQNKQNQRLIRQDSLKWELRKAERELRECGDSFIELLDAYYDNGITKEQFLKDKLLIKKKEEELKAKVAEIQEKMDETKVILSNQLEMECEASQIAKHSGIEKLDEQIMKELIEKIVIYPNDFVQIHWNFSL